MRIVILLVSLAVISVLHFLTGISSSVEHLFHVLFRLAYFVPLMLSAWWFGVRGGAWMSAACCLLLSAHIFVNWSGNLGENMNQIAMVVLFPFFGIAGGLFVDRERAGHEQRRRQEKLAERRAVIESISSLSAALNAKDSYTREHSEAVAALAVRIGTELSLPEESLDLLYLAGITHDIGKIGLKDDVLFKPSKVSAEEIEQIHRHPEVAAAILGPITGADRIAELVLCHHEHIDGSGYPRGLKCHEISLEVRVLTVADIYSALVEQRTYKLAMQSEDALTVLRSMSGIKVDTRVVQALEQVLSRNPPNK